MNKNARGNSQPKALAASRGINTSPLQKNSRLTGFIDGAKRLFLY